ncbi:ankyrin repeat protein [Nonomuraea thailandensis]|uniref:Ankyrin repeat protein n=1 Tax=Nonomuraea thailandensis TaxID=1188745 RepID=A0A9X2GB99_9ACTN|nr:ankyrin repeat domain-containing protein [Nonomuraea thailandensis]MCP2354515.1 ankyrin repeat protein [Nonomuraea thailandensis]
MSDEELRSAAMTGQAEEVGRLLAAGTPPDAPDGTALYLAAVQGHAEVVRKLLAAGADPDRESEGDGEGLPLCAAACWGHLDTVNALLDAGADPDRPEAPGAMPALHWAAANDRVAVARALLGRGADPGLRDSAGNTPLSRAAERGSAALVQALLDHGATPAARPLELARRYAGRDIEAEVRARAGQLAPEGARIVVRRERAEGGGVRVVAEVRDSEGRLRSETCLGTGHAEIVRLLQARLNAGPGERGSPGMSAGA